jgi:hypothetical protein
MEARYYKQALTDGKMLILA